MKSLQDAAKGINFLFDEEIDSMVSIVSETEIRVLDSCYDKDTPEADENIIKVQVELHDEGSDILKLIQGDDLIMITMPGALALCKAIRLVYDQIPDFPEDLSEGS